MVDCSSTSRERSNFRQLVYIYIYPFIWTKEDQAATEPVTICPCLLSSSLSLPPLCHRRFLSTSPMGGAFFLPRGVCAGFLCCLEFFIPFFFIELLLSVSRIKVTSSEKTYLSIIKLASLLFSLMTDCLGYNS